MKKKMAILLTAVLALCMGFGVYAAESAGWLIRQQTESRGAGQVDVTIGTAMALGKETRFTMTLTESGKKSGESAFITLSGNSSEKVSFSFPGLADGTYTLKVSSAGFEDYTQEINVASRAYTVNLTVGFLEGVSYQAGAVHPGVLLLGDVDGNRVVNEADRKALVDAIDRYNLNGNKELDPADLKYDLNGDGEVNLVDLEYLARCQADKTVNTRASLEESVSPALVSVRQGQGTVVEGSPEALLQEEGVVILKPAGGVISEVSPVSVEFDFAAVEKASEADGIIIETVKDNPIGKAIIDVVYTDEAGSEHTEQVPVAEGVYFLLRSSEVRTERDGNGNIHIYLGSQVALKKVTLTIMGTKNTNLAEISKVEFVNGMESRIPEPEMDIPQNLQASVASETISLSWNSCVNVTGYEILIRRVEDGEQETALSVRNTVDITSFGGKPLENLKEYRVRVQSVNGTWRSGYGEEVSATPEPNGPPKKPDRVSARGEYQKVTVSWKDMKDTNTYNLYYKESNANEYTEVKGIETNSYAITADKNGENLKDRTQYVVYVTGVNQFGESGPSLPAAAYTTDLEPPQMTEYNLINIGGKGEKGAHIVSAVRFGGGMYESPLDTDDNSAWGTVDHDGASYYEMATWDDGGYNPVGGALKVNSGLLYEFDDVYKIDTITFYNPVGIKTNYFYAKMSYWDADGNKVNVSGLSLSGKSDPEGRPYYEIKLSQPIEAKKIQFGLARYSASGTISVAEVYFYRYDELMNEIMALYADDLHTVLKQEVTQSTIDGLRAKINAPDPFTGAYHPSLEVLERELQTAEAILNDKALNASVTVHNGITTKDIGRGFSGLNAWQPLGVNAAAGEEIMVYVGSNTKKTGEATSLQLVATQYHAESSPMSSGGMALKVGPNKIQVPKISSTYGFELGGALYVQYTGNDSNERYAVRVSGGVQVPVLDLYQITDETERLERTKNFVTQLQTYVGQMADKHQEVHQNSSNENVKLDYDQKNCILGATDILLDTMMLSLPAQQIWNGAGSGTTEQQARKILDSMDAMEDMMYLFYQHKGLNKNAAEALNQIPKGHLNIRYQRMFAGAFMYASGNHIGIEWPETAGMMGGVPVVSDSEGRYVSGRYFGWGIAHEIGHCINQGAYAVAEITNNYFSVLAQAQDDNGTVRFSYDKVFEKVTSGTLGKASNVFTQLGMYWQLHLAYDTGYNYKTYENYEEQLQNLFFARVDTYARNQAKAPAPGGISLTLAGDRDQDLMRLSCAAAQKDILDFFRRWGMVPNEDTIAYAAQFAKETRAIYYANDDARVYSLQGSGSVLGTEGGTAAVGDGTTAVINVNAANQVDFTFSSQNIPQEDILGYEIVRCSISGGETVKEPAGFATGSTFSDTVYVNNRTVWYEITLIDKYLNRSAVKELSPVKIEHDGSLDKSFWTVSTGGLIPADVTEGTGNEDSPCAPPDENPIAKAVDGDVNTVYTAAAGANPEIMMEFNRTLTVAGFKYTAGAGVPAGSYEVQVRSGNEWITAASGNFGQDKVTSVPFANGDGKYVSTYSADAVKLILKVSEGSQLSIAELDVLGPTGDNVDFRRTGDGTAAIGRLAEDFKYGTEEKDVIPKGSIIFTGAYKGNPAYNVVILFDQNGNIVGGVNEAGAVQAHQIILAPVPDEGDIRNVSDGTWIYWLEPDQNLDLSALTKVRAELYRVNDALTNEGQRLVSDSLFERVPAEADLPEIRFSGENVPQRAGSVSGGDVGSSEDPDSDGDNGNGSTVSSGNGNG